MICNICSQPTTLIGRVLLLNKYDVCYFQCSKCYFVQTEKPFWIEEAYSDAITSSDIGLVNRNVVMAKVSRPLLTILFGHKMKYMDYGGGYGMYVRLMRDYGFDFYRSDKFCTNLFAKGFDAETVGRNQYGLVTAFEVFEHLVNPIAEIEHMLQFTNSILFSTLLMPETNPKPQEWWYYGLEHGQHVSLYTYRSLLVIADVFGLNLYSNGISLHLLTKEHLSPLVFRLLSKPRVAALLNLFFIEKSLLPTDYYTLTNKHLN